MTVFKRICLRDYTITAQNGESFTVERGRTYTVSPIWDDGQRTVFSRYWVRVPAEIFEPESYHDHRS